MHKYRKNVQTKYSVNNNDETQFLTSEFWHV